MQMKMHLFIKRTTKVPGACVVQQDVSIAVAWSVSPSVSLCICICVFLYLYLLLCPYLYLSVNVSLSVPQHGKHEAKCKAALVSAVFAQLSPSVRCPCCLTTYWQGTHTLTHTDRLICIRPHVDTPLAPSSLWAILLTSIRGGGSLSLVAANPFSVC